jgi:hypothetical protein
MGQWAAPGMRLARLINRWLLDYYDLIEVSGYHISHKHNRIPRFHPQPLGPGKVAASSARFTG